MLDAILLTLALVASNADPAQFHDKAVRDLIAFDEPGFPVHEAGMASPIPQPLVATKDRIAAIPEGAKIATSGTELNDLLARSSHSVLIWRHGSTFPAESWTAILGFLERGGSLLSLCGEPFTRPVTGSPGARHIGERTLAPSHQLGLLHPRLESAGGLTCLYEKGRDPERVLAPNDQAVAVAVFEPRFSNSQNVPNEEGSPGPREASLQRLALLTHGGLRDGGPPLYAGAVAIDRLRGRFAGGRWVFRLLTSVPTQDETTRLVREALREPAEIAVTPTLACYHEGEDPTLRLVPVAPSRAAQWTVHLTLMGPDGGELTQLDAMIETTHGESFVQLPACKSKGLYRVRVECDAIAPFETGFEVFDPDLLRTPSAVEFRGDQLYRDGKLVPLIGTTSMSPDVHREFLFEPNPVLWNQRFATFAAMKFNVVRTGLWSGWKRAAPAEGEATEAFLRSIEAYALAARRHGILVVFNCFAFLPETWGGSHPYLDSKAVAAQLRFVKAIASRVATDREWLFDLVNEPSFAPPAQMWSCRPTYGEIEESAFLSWLKQRYGGDSFEAVVRERWHLAPDEKIGLPTPADFESPQVFADRRPQRASDFLHFAQDAFASWAKSMSAAIRSVAPDALITVGQDEGGVLERPSPLVHAPVVDFTSMHSWWWNDALLLDSLAAKAPGKPLLVSETGLQPREVFTGESQRDPYAGGLLLSRKLASAFAGRACGVIQWCYDANPYMNSDAEALIGLVRADGSASWELAAMRGFSEFLARNAARLEYAGRPDVAFVLPQSDLTGPRPMPIASIAHCLERLTYGLGLTVQVYSEWNLRGLSDHDVIVIPAARGYDQCVFDEVEIALHRGATVLMSGWPYARDRFAHHGVPMSGPQRLARRQTTTIGDTTLDVEFPLAIQESAAASSFASGMASFPVDKGRVIASALPLEWSLDPNVVETFYRAALKDRMQSALSKPASRIFMTRIPLKDGTLVVAINETDRGEELEFAPANASREKIYLDAGQGKLILLDASGQWIDTTQW